MSRLVTLVFFLFANLVKAQYEVPDVLVEALSPKGLRVSIPDEDGVSLFAFHGKVNEEMNGREAGRYSIDIIKPKNGRWVYYDKSVRLKVGDVVYFWINVDYDDGNGKRGYIKDDQMFRVTELIPDESVSTTSTTTTHRPPDTEATRLTLRPTKTPATTKKPTTTETPECKDTPTIVNGKQSCQGAIIFNEDFKTFSGKKWSPEIKFAGEPDYPFVIYNIHEENLYVIENKLHIKPSLLEDRYGAGYATNPEGLNLGSECTGVPESFNCVQKPRAWQILPPVLSAKITTKDHLSFLYGIVEIRARLPKGDWLYPELFLKSRNDAYGPGLESGLIRVAFTPGNKDSSKVLSGGLVLGDSTFARNVGIKKITSEVNWSNEFHVFRMEWKPDSITLSVDEKIYANVYPPDDGFASLEQQLEIQPDTAERWKKGSQLAPFDKEMYLILGVGVGGQCFPDTTDDTKPWTNDDPKAQLNFYKNQDTWNRTWNDRSEMVVDYVKVWAL